MLATRNPGVLTSMGAPEPPPGRHNGASRRRRAYPCVSTDGSELGGLVRRRLSRLAMASLAG